jgi:putative aldouronate transport system substrate-binding protein
MLNEDAINRPKQQSRRRFVKRLAITALSVPVGGVFLAACGATATPTAAPTRAATTAAVATTAVAPATTAPAVASPTVVPTIEGVLKSPAPGVPDAFLKPPPVFKATQTVPGKGSLVKMFLATNAVPPTPKGENKFWQELEKRLGVTWEATLVPTGSYAEKLAVLAASGELPDLTYVDIGAAPEQARLIQQGAYTDLTPYLTGDAIKEFPNLAALSPQIWKNSSIKGKIYGVPRPRFLTGNLAFIRQDWLQTLGIAQPKNAEEVFAIMDAFTKKDPNGDGQVNTWGWGFTGGSSSEFNFIMNMFRVPNEWKQNSDGSLTYFIETPEYKEALAFLRRLYENNLIFPDSLTQTRQQTVDNYLAGKYGFISDSITGLPNATGRRAAAQKLNDKANVLPFIAPGFDGGKSNHWLGLGYLGMASIPSKVGRDKEKAKELLRVLDYLSSPFGSEEYNFLNFGIDGVHNEVKSDGSRVINDLGRKDKSDLPNIAQGQIPLFYPGFPDQPALMQNTIKQLLEIGVANPALNAESNTWNTKSKELAAFLNDRIIRILNGRDQLSAIDDMVKEWKSRGGEQAAKEFALSLK